MAFPFKHKNIAQGVTCVELHKAGSDDGTTPVSCSLATGGGYVASADLPYNAWLLGINFWAENNGAAITMKVHAYVDHAQSVVTDALYMIAYGTTTTVTVISLAATSVASGHVAKILPYAPSATDWNDSFIGSHGLRITIATTSATGTFDYELVAVPQA